MRKVYPKGWGRVGGGAPRRSARGAVFAGLALAGILAILYWATSWPFGGRASEALMLRALPPVAAPAEHVLVEIDDATVKKWADRPVLFWGDRLAKVIRAVRQSGARALAIDIAISADGDGLLDEAGAPEAFRPNRELTRALIQKPGFTSLAATRDGLGRAVLPHPALLFADESIAANVSSVFVVPDSDDVVRQIDGFPGFMTGWLLRKTGAAVPSSIRVNYRAPRGRRIGVLDLLAGRGGELLRGKVVILCLANSTTPDRHPTPIRTSLFGGVILGLAFETARLGISLRSPSTSGEALILFALGAMVSLAMSIAGWRSFALAAGIGVAWGFVCLGLFRENVLFPLVPGWISALLVIGAATVARSATERREREELERLFGQNVSPEILDYLRESGVSASAGTRASAAILFLDIKGSTGYGRTHRPEEVFEAYNRCFRVAYPEVASRGGLVNRFLGDGFLALFGVPYPVDDPVGRAVAAAEAMIERWEVECRANPAVADLGLSVGIHYGEALMGYLGVAERAEFTVVGDAVNHASLVEASTRAHGASVILSAEARDHMRMPSDWPEVDIANKEGAAVGKGFLVRRQHAPPAG